MNTSNKDYVTFQHVQKTYDGENLVVKDFNLAIAPGEFVTMLGPSGSGKTTCLMMLAGFETATRGEIYIDGIPVNNLAPHKRDIGMVFQNYALFPHMTIAENLAFPLKVRKLNQGDVDRKVMAALEMVELAHVAFRYPKQLSGGQQQRVALARALVFEPKLVLMDEPLGALDKQLREQMQMEIKHLHEKLGITILYVTHDQDEALTMSDRIAVFNNGAVQQLATPTDLYESPSNAFVAQFIGENNQIHGVVSDVESETCTVKVGQQNVLAKPVAVGILGDATTLSIRPEKISVSPEELQCDNEFSGQLREMIYHGDHHRLVVSVPDLGELIVKVPNDNRNTAPLKLGEACTIGWHSRDCHALDSTASLAAENSANQTSNREHSEQGVEA
ncbi:ABC transporter ATP-binding protein [Vibrio sp. T187]|uniref:ABC transporter ATP-binding protein n=1 Tax=Vibrio TaxID=662 RepID=UPI0010C99197|nr:MULTISPECIES: ABC transporter ATP-binding protein [Vibrio]MBW3695009.1 ABC transporter ATP-binding protein [Vibrio sp. T187]